MNNKPLNKREREVASVAADLLCKGSPATRIAKYCFLKGMTEEQIRTFCDELDGSNVRVKYTNKKGFHLFGSRTQMFDEGHPFLAPAIPYFYKHFENPLVDLIEGEFPNEREVIAFLEFFGDKSFAGWHEPDDPTKRLVCFDIMVGHKNRKFLMPQDFVKLTAKYGVIAPRVIYTGNLNDEFIGDVKIGKYDVVEGVVCKGTEKTGAHRGGTWMAKIKTQDYLNRLWKRFGDEGVEKYGE